MNIQVFLTPIGIFFIVLGQLYPRINIFRDETGISIQWQTSKINIPWSDLMAEMKKRGILNEVVDERP